MPSVLPLRLAPPPELRAIQFVAFDFDGVFTDDAVYVTQEGIEMVRCWRGDGLGLRKLEALGIGAAIISTEVNPVVGVRARKMGIRCLQGIPDKRRRLEELGAELGLPLNRFAFVGNDINDLQCLSAVALPIAVQNAHPDVLGCVRYQTEAAGGRGAVREICDAFERAHQDSPGNGAVSPE